MKTFLLFLVLLGAAQAMFFDLPFNRDRCLRDQVYKDELVRGEYRIIEPFDNVKIDIKVSDLNGHILYQKENTAGGKFSFTTDEYHLFQICFVSRSFPSTLRGEQQVELQLKRGVEASSDGKLAKSNFTPLENELRRLGELSSKVIKAFHSIKRRQKDMGATNRSTNSRLLTLPVLSMLCLISFATLQMLYLQNYFRTKKLID